MPAVLVEANIRYDENREKEILLTGTGSCKNCLSNMPGKLGALQLCKGKIATLPFSSLLYIVLWSS